MKKYITVSLLIMLLTLTSCKTQDVINDPIIKDTDLEVIEPVIEEGSITDNPCTVTDHVTLRQTDTISSFELWSNSSVCDNLIYEDGYIQLANYETKGILETGSFYLDSFDSLVPSWNVLIDDDSKVSILIALGNSEGFGDYYVMSLWQTDNKLSFTNQEDDYGYVSVDTVTPLKSDIDRIRFKVILGKSENNNTKLKNISITTVLTNSTNNYLTTHLTEHEIVIAPRQQLSIPLIGRSICSPTSLSMVLNYYGFTESPQTVARNVYDNGSKTYGNWSFNASYTGGFGLYSKVQYVNDINILMAYIENDVPLVLSINTTSKDSLVGSIMAYPVGHLIVLTGFTLKDDIWYAVVNDPAEYEDTLVRREYKLDQLLNAWRGYIYVIQETEFE